MNRPRASTYHGYGDPMQDAVDVDDVGDCPYCPAPLIDFPGYDPVEMVDGDITRGLWHVKCREDALAAGEVDAAVDAEGWPDDGGDDYLGASVSWESLAADERFLRGDQSEEVRLP